MGTLHPFLAPALLALGSNLTAEQIRDQLQRIGDVDPEAAHTIADALATSALQAIADGYPDPARVAADVLTVLSAEFPRWCG